ncbi:hypothetical protein PRUPE_8G023000 [Prunus persica]|uniref:Transcription factor BTF3 n=2 Tax=Prunus persica TaxID=3760 RepID=A0A251MV29_PRUPE|nr:hypothetical protein PRUPE_8G023000 [Prunus persica]
MNWEKLMKMAGAVHTGGKGSMRRKEKTVHKTTTTDDKRLQSTIKRIEGPDNLDNLMKLAEQFQKQAPGASAAGGTTPQEDDDDEVPELVAGENFEAAAEEKQAS